MSDASATADTTHGKILFVDDSRLMRFSAQKCLAARYEVVVAEDGESAIRALDSDPEIRAVVTDLMMPGVDGFGVIEHVRTARDESLRSLPIMALTGSESAGDRLRALQLGADEMMTKPFRPNALLERVEALVSNRQPRIEKPTIEVPAAINVERDRSGFLGRLMQAMSLHMRQDLPISLLQVRLESARVESGARVKLEGPVLKALMRQLELVLVRTVRVEDTVGRTGTDHRTLLLPATPAEGARALRERIRKAVAEHAFELKGRALQLKLEIYLHEPKKTVDPGQLVAFVSADDDRDGVVQVDAQQQVG